MHRTLLLTVAALALVLTACGGRHYPNRAGYYRGPNRLDFAINRPVQRRMPPEINQGSAEVIEGRRRSYVVLELRMFDQGERPCRINARRTGYGHVDVTSGQTCSSRFRYDGYPVVAEVRIDRGYGDFDDRNFQLDLEGPFRARARDVDGSTVPLTGYAHWSFVGTR